ncbi:MAG: glycoside hydrolase family 2, partial [FCB group bacterium]|nr:glycoside hydrolase family 2 [FCB group bacterium]
PQMEREDWLNLNGLWQFEIVNNLDTIPSGKTLPDNILVPFPIESGLSGIMKSADYAWYKRNITIPADWSGKRVLLHFGAIDWEATIFLNGSRIGSHRGGYDPFYFDITDALNGDDEQELIVGVFDPSDAGDQSRGKQVKEPKHIWYTPITGIWQTVWCEAVPATYIESLRITPDIDAQCLRLNVQLNTTNSSATIKAAVSGNEQQICAATGLSSEELVLNIPTPELWTPDSPFLYDLAVTLHHDGNIIDSVNSYFGMRKIEIGKDQNGVTRILLNGEFTFQMGPLDQGYWPDGLYTAPTDEALKFDIEMSKRLGFNMIRKHAKVEPQRWYYWCDKLGALVWQDMPSGNNASDEGRSQFESEMRRMIHKFYNHPSIVMWVVFNEAWGQFDDERMTNIARELDPHRIISNVSGWYDAGVGDIIDVHCYPGPGWVEAETNRAAVIGEYGGPRLIIDGHTWAREADWGYFNLSSKDEFTDNYRGMLKNIHQKIANPGISAAVFTQLTDVEVECNGLLTYDRKIIKLDVDTTRAANRGEFESLGKIIIVEPTSPTSYQQPITWNYTFDIPGKDWIQKDFNDRDWKSGEAGFGRKGARQAIIRTDWTTDDIWIRRHFNTGSNLPEELVLLVHHLHDAEIYINGLLAMEVKDHRRLYYEEYPISREVRKTITPKGNLIAVHAKKGTQHQFIDAGIYGLAH